ncbi:Ubiquitin carboxyl-terminal hydrolase [Aduncisulcus paluster]|uniref:Ubiquitin carboxyl-terminal hydrolase n=1 Tax=Aduncisulcus paluster TaxID=2918883 RepID=A0ABQ5K436_9EUKA|nr:Ubiquitin carboxyl-terminal hydrolase [Aduncisulcus paluster]
MSDRRKAFDEYDKYTPVPKGLGNIGNTCFFNSATQCLVHLKYLFKALTEWKYGTMKSPLLTLRSELPVLNRTFMWILLRSYTNPEEETYGRYLTPRQFHNAFVHEYSAFRGYGQHDSHECSVLLLEALDLGIKKFLMDKCSYPKTKPSPIEEIFNFPVEQTVTCAQCECQFLSKSSWMDLTLELKRTKIQQQLMGKPSSMASDDDHLLYSIMESMPGREEPKKLSPHSLEYLLWLFTEPDPVPRDAGYVCERCSLRKAKMSNKNAAFQPWLDVLHAKQEEAIEKHGCVIRDGEGDIDYELDKLRKDQSWLRSNNSLLVGNRRELSAIMTEKRPVIRRCELKGLPKVLMIHLNRFNSGERRRSMFSSFFSFGGSKDDTSIQYPEYLDLSHLIPGYKYRLSSISIHSGSLGFGHYTAFARCGKEWYYFNDSMTEPTSPVHALTATSGAYMLYYELEEEE